MMAMVKRDCGDAVVGSAGQGAAAMAAVDGWARQGKVELGGDLGRLWCCARRRRAREGERGSGCKGMLPGSRRRVALATGCAGCWCLPQEEGDGLPRVGEMEEIRIRLRSN